MDLSILAKNIKLEMEKQNLSIQDLRKKAGVGYATLYDLLHGKRQNINTSTLEKIAMALNCTQNDLLGVEVIEYEVSDLNDALNLILESDDLKLDGKFISSEEKEYLLDLFEFGIKTLRKSRKKFLS